MDINCDMGESYGQFKVGNDQALFPYISSCNIACGFHGGDPLTIQQTIQQALLHKVNIGAHPSYPDLAGFGRRKMSLSTAELCANILYQVAAIKGMVESMGGQLAHIKPHGALYHQLSSDKAAALSVFNTIQSINPQLPLIGMAGSPLEQWAQESKIPFIAEAFADRRYIAPNQLMPRQQKGAVIQDPTEAVAQVQGILEQQKINTPNGSYPMRAQSICIHGDNPAALAILKALHKVL